MPCMPTCIASRGRARHRGNCTRLACGPGIRTRPKLTSPPLTPCGNWRGAAAAWRRRRRLKITHSPPNSPPCAPSGRLACPNPAMQPEAQGAGCQRLGWHGQSAGTAGPAPHHCISSSGSPGHSLGTIPRATGCAPWPPQGPRRAGKPPTALAYWVSAA